MSFLDQIDPEVSHAFEQEKKRQRETVNLIASENYASKAVLEAQGSFLTSKYAEGYPHRRYYGGCEYVDIVEDLAIQRARELYHAGHAGSCIMPGMPTSSHTVGLRLTWRHIMPCWNMVIPF